MAEGKILRANLLHAQTNARKDMLLELYATGLTIVECLSDARIGVTYSAYKKWRERDPHFAARVDVIRGGLDALGVEYTGTRAEFANRYFKGMRYAEFHMMFLNEVDQMPPGNIVMCLWPPEHGKFLLPSEPVPTPSGWTTMGDLRAGDWVFDADGEQTQVTYVSPRCVTPGYRLTFGDGNQIDCGEDHLWEVKSRNWRTADGGRYGVGVVDTRALHHMVNANGRPVVSIPVAGALELPEADLPLDPYTLGAWLGDGHTSDGRITCPDDPEIIANCAFEVGHVLARDGRDYTWRLHGLRTALRTAEVFGSKHIPIAYQRASRGQRLALLRGLMDTDGSCSRTGQCEFTTTLKRLADDVEELIWSLGHRVRRYGGRATLRGKDCGPKYRLSFYPAEPVFSLDRKVARQRLDDRQGDRMRRRTIVAVEPIGPIEGVCIAVDNPRHLYVAGRSFICTHNTTTFENYATEQLATDPQFRMTVASANIRIASKIVSRIKNRLEPAGPFKELVRDFGPFKPPVGMGRHDTVAQPWSSQVFNVYKKSDQDERDYNMQALGYKSEIVSTRCDHLHLDDLQSLKNLSQAEPMEEWVRQDALSRPGMSGKTSIVGTRVGEDDIYERLSRDPDLDGILKVLKFKAISTDYTDPDNPVQKGLWPEKYTLDDYDKMRRKAGPEAWDRGYMMNPGASRKDSTFQDEHLDPCKNPLLSLLHRPTVQSYVLVGLDPALGGVNCIIACEQRTDPTPKLIIRAIREAKNLRTNEQIMQELNQVIALMNQTGRVTDVVIETMNFQRGLARDERLLEMRQHYGFAMREHLTGWNKYDEDIGVASMVTSFIKREIELPWAEDDTTRTEIGELVRQLKAWRPGARGTKLRQDRVMALWFVWILWRSRWKQTNQSSGNNGSFQRQGVPWRGTKTGLIIPVGAKI